MIYKTNDGKENLLCIPIFLFFLLFGTFLSASLYKYGCWWHSLLVFLLLGMLFKNGPFVPSVVWMYFPKIHMLKSYWELGPLGGDEVMREGPSWMNWCCYKRSQRGAPLPFSVLWGYKEKSVTWKRALTQSYRHPDFGLLASRTVRNKFLLSISHPFCSICCSSLNGLLNGCLIIPEE